MYLFSVIGKHGVSDDYTWANWAKFPEFFGIACFSLEGIGLIFPIRGSLQKPSNYKKMFNV
jgi:proton-coupled amino acid transporter